MIHQITALPQTLYTVAGFHGPTSKGREGRGWKGWKGGYGREEGGVREERERGCPVFFLSRPVNPKHNPSTCRMMLRCCPAMAIESKF